MTLRRYLLIAAAAALPACISNEAPGNDREMQLDPPEPAAEQMAAEAALENVATGSLMPEIMTDADIRSLGAAAGPCIFRMTTVGFPVFLYSTDATGGGVIKLNGKLIPLAPRAEGRYASGPVDVTVRNLESDDPGQQMAEFVVRFADAPNELGFRGFRECSAR